MKRKLEYDDEIHSNETCMQKKIKTTYEVNIDFDEAHREWILNKIKLENGCYKYKKIKKHKKQKKIN